MSTSLFSHWSFRGKALWFLFSTFFFGSSLVFVGALFISWIAGSSVDTVFEVASDPNNPSARTTLLILTFLNQVGAFLLSVWAFERWIGLGKPMNLLKKESRYSVWVIAGLLAIVFLPLLEGLLWLNDMLAPAGSAFRAWVESADERTEAMYASLLQMKTGVDIVVVVLLAAVLPALGEEMAFRGVLQRLVTGSTGSVHAGIWISAAIFSLYHFQFVGFLPRLILGAGFGYMVLWSGSLWPAILAHFTNNLVTILAHFVGKERGLFTEDAVTDFALHPLVLSLSLAGCGLGFWAFRAYAKSGLVKAPESEKSDEDALNRPPF